MKPESRILVITQPLGGIYVGIVVRGVMGLEDVLPIDTCKNIAMFIESRRKIAGEIKYVYVANDVDEGCRRLFQELHNRNIVKVVSAEFLPQQLRRAVLEAESVAKLIAYRFITALRDDRGFKY